MDDAMIEVRGHSTEQALFEPKRKVFKTKGHIVHEHLVRER